MGKVRIKRGKEKDIVPDSVIENLFPLDSVRRITTILYGRAMTGKSLLAAYEAARLASIHGGGVLVITSETNYVVDTTFSAIKAAFEAFGVKYKVVFEESADRISAMLYKMTRDTTMDKEEYEEENGSTEGWVPEWRVVVVDSLRGIQLAEEDRMSYFMRKSTRGRSQTTSVVGRVVRSLSRYTAAADGWGFAIASATSMVGTGLWRGIADEKPSYCSKALHDAAAVVWLVSAEKFPDNIRAKVVKMGKKLTDVKMAVLVMHRAWYKPGAGIVYEFSKDEEKGHVKPVPLFKVAYSVEEEEMAE